MDPILLPEPDVYGAYLRPLDDGESQRRVLQALGDIPFDFMRDRLQPHSLNLESGFYPYPEARLDDAVVRRVRDLFEAHYGGARIPGRPGKLSWERFGQLRQSRYGYLSKEDADRVYNHRRQRANELYVRHCAAPHPGGRECDELQRVRHETCAMPDGWSTRTWSRTEDAEAGLPPLLGQDVLHSADDGKTFLLGQYEVIDRAVRRDPDRFIYRPFAQNHTLDGWVSWNVLANLAAVSCALHNSAAIFPVRFFLTRNWAEDIATMEVKPRPLYDYVGTIVLNFDRLRSRDRPHFSFTEAQASASTVILLHVYAKRLVGQDGSTVRHRVGHMDAQHEKLTLFNVRGRMVDWGDFSERKRITYYEVRQVLAHLHEHAGDRIAPLHVYQLYDRSQATAATENSKYVHILVSALGPGDLTDALRNQNATLLRRGGTEIRLAESSARVGKGAQSVFVESSHGGGGRSIMELVHSCLGWNDPGSSSSSPTNKNMAYNQSSSSSSSSSLQIVPRMTYSDCGTRMQTDTGSPIHLLSYITRTFPGRRQQDGPPHYYGGGGSEDYNNHDNNNNNSHTPRAMRYAVACQVLKRSLSASASLQRQPPHPNKHIISKELFGAPPTILPEHCDPDDAYASASTRWGVKQAGMLARLPPDALAGNVTVIAANGNLADAVLRSSAKARVSLVLRGARNICPVLNLLNRSGDRLTLTYSGVLLSVLSSGLPPPSRPPATALLVDAYVTWHSPRLANLLLASLLHAHRGGLGHGGDAVVMLTLPRGRRDVLVRALALWWRAFDTLELVAKPRKSVEKVTEHADAILYCSGFRGIGGQADVDAAERLREALLCGDGAAAIQPLLGDFSVPRALTAAVNAAYDAHIEALEAMAGGRRTLGTDRLAAKSALAALQTADAAPLQVSYRDVHSVPVLRPEMLVGRLDYVERRRDFEPRCHWGQLKLLMSEWDFLNATRDIWSAERTVLFYAGAADGTHIPLLADLFPRVHRWFLYDGAPFAPHVARHPRITAFSGRDGFVTDGTPAAMLALAAREHARAILFVSDIRIQPGEADVQSDMLSQARWGVRLGARAMLLKFRLPYPQAPDGRASVPSAAPGDFPSAARHVVPPVPPVPEVPEHRRALYLDGEVQPQLFAPMNSTETRLYVRASPSQDGKNGYALRYYDVQDYERECYFYNVSTRRLADVSASPPLDLYLPGFDRGWESIQTFRIVRSYCAALADDPADLDAAAMRLLARTMLRLSGWNRRTLAICAGDTLAKYSKQRRLEGHHRERVEMWKRVVDAQEAEARGLQRRRIARHGPAVLPRDLTADLIRLLL